MLPIIKEKLALVPNLPGSYQMLDEFGTIIYVGKAKNLHRRVSSYFNREQTGKTKKLVNDIRDFTYIVATSETEAFLIEINLIKKYDPKYNIMLRDDKSYPYIEYISKPYPRLKISRYLTIKKQGICLMRIRFLIRLRKVMIRNLVGQREVQFIIF